MRWPVVVGSLVFIGLVLVAFVRWRAGRERLRREYPVFGTTTGVSYSAGERHVAILRPEVNVSLTLTENGRGGCYMVDSIYQLAVERRVRLDPDQLAVHEQLAERGRLSIQGTAAQVNWDVLLTSHKAPRLIVLEKDGAYEVTLSQPLTKYLRYGCAADDVRSTQSP